MQIREIILIEKHIINSKELYDLTHIAKNLYNASLYVVRQSFCDKVNSKMIFYNELDKLMKEQENYKLLPATASQQVLRKINDDFNSYFKSIKDWKKNSSKYKGMPKLPNYKKDYNNLIYTNQSSSIKNGYINLKVSQLKSSGKL